MEKRMKFHCFILVVILLFMNCKKANKKKDVLKTLIGNSKEYSLKYEIFYDHDKIKFCLISSFNNKNEVSCETLIKKNDGYYSKNTYSKGLSNSKDYNLILSISKDTTYSFRSAGNVNSHEIKKINDTVFKSTNKIIGISNYEENIFFDKSYKILKIESYYGDKKFIFKSER
ncbi:hypothetical protein SGQ83_00045 [Flavobacterium sp. Fl-318]|uniref:Lipoprotein n=1 Tax=Flavobacterium cupriresistens TaxID=2893885 RepID=A0ABU4R560_9FLAO|nr:MULTISPECIES: hypothetical protein [unclassified Flavobacterium]MDX6187727.1 hypothetical protein [Flavobacterium sp. Fl-318]UFH42350.1 hypothetical protein LNP23_21405 [Flavobacterium sp. F-323]